MEFSITDFFIFCAVWITSQTNIDIQIQIQTQIWKKFILYLATKDFLWLFLKFHKELSTTNLLTKSKSPEICHFVDNSGRFFDITSKNSKISELIISESRDEYPRYSGSFIYTILALTKV